MSTSIFYEIYFEQLIWYAILLRLWDWSYDDDGDDYICFMISA